MVSIHIQEGARLKMISIHIQEGARLKMDLSSRKERLEKKRFHLQASRGRG